MAFSNRYTVGLFVDGWHLQPTEAVHSAAGVGGRAQDEKAALRSQRSAQLLCCEQVALARWAVQNDWVRPPQASHLRVARPVGRRNQHLQGSSTFSYLNTHGAAAQAAAMPMQHVASARTAT